MNPKVALRKEAVRLYWQAGLSKAEISRQLKKTRRWVVRWLTRYDHEQGEKSLEDHSSASKHRKEAYPKRIKKMVLQSRKARKAQHRRYAYALISAKAIYYELRDLGVKPCPPPRTIHFWLKQAGEVDKPTKPCKESNPTYPAPRCKAVNDVHELDLKGAFYLKNSSQKYYLIVVRDVFGKKVALRVLKEKEMEQAIDFLVATWQKIGLPKFLQMDNGLEFRGSNAYPRSLSRLMRVCLDVKVQPVFIPKSEPWRNGVDRELEWFDSAVIAEGKSVQKRETVIQGSAKTGNLH